MSKVASLNLNIAALMPEVAPSNLTFAQCPMPNAQCPMPNAQCPVK
ncbi:hypothetical protein [Calothrix sp. FACHB-168]|nr:hypothetical protein [Calothrix sp. FACHB-168]MBD2202843.1 hypothetical protein [Calothrix sp. FACHB-168]